MKLSDIMSAAGLAGFAEAALVLFLIVFVAVCLSVFSKKNAGHHERARFLPCEDAPRVDAGASLPGPTPSSITSSRVS
jgi:cbb3-type cytochrome oxidase subunit 3